MKVPTDGQRAGGADNNQGPVWIFITPSKSVQIACADSIRGTTGRGGNPCVSQSRSLITPPTSTGLLWVTTTSESNKQTRRWAAQCALERVHSVLISLTERDRGVHSSRTRHFVWPVSRSMTQKSEYDTGWLCRDRYAIVALGNFALQPHKVWNNRRWKQMSTNVCAGPTVYPFTDLYLSPQKQSLHD